MIGRAVRRVAGSPQVDEWRNRQRLWPLPLRLSNSGTTSTHAWT